MLGFPALIGGLILLIAGPHWFTGAHTVGVILTVVGGAVVAFTVLVLLAAFWATGR